MKVLHIFTTIMCILILAACNNQGNSSTTQSDSSDIVMLSSETSDVHEEKSIPSIAQTYLDDQTNDIASYKAIHLEDQLFVAFNATPLKQAVEQKIEKRVKKDLETLTDIKEIQVTSDQKFFMELTKLENQQLSKEEAQKKLKKLKKLLKEKT
ncbi:YhcN/YlaJ family sporulation lipoprotein [Gracilibacillus suaedae]|uniref:YhcN/YlaJ family sporulation lipoprotein n=1 Tax=Gracilibacillus suaedae TaxID=2820273 RepID=UPI001ABDE1EA|nr:YhcN/YlaJ family sporulation lipoprotein [Gracilibacillus suaedae]